MGAKLDKWKAEYRENLEKEKEKDRIKQEKKRKQDEGMTSKDKAVKDVVSAGKWYAAFRWGIPALLVIGFILFVIFTWILNQFGIYLG